MMDTATGPRITELADASNGPFVVVSPYITRVALRKLLSLLDGRPIMVVTDWRPSSVASGATDPRIIDDLARHTATELWLLPNLHAKLYMAEQVALVGSTNLTARGTGWFGAGNLELLVRTDRDDEAVKAFMAAVRRFRLRATPADADAALRAAKLLASQPTAPADELLPLLATTVETFVDTYIHEGGGAPSIAADVATLSVPPELNERELVRHLQSQLRAQPYYGLATIVSQRTGAAGDVEKQRDDFLRTVRAYGIEEPATEELGDYSWHVLMTWMERLLPREFTTIATGQRVLVSNAGTF
jgi:hypothetical protein